MVGVVEGVTGILVSAFEVLPRHVEARPLAGARTEATNRRLRHRRAVHSKSSKPSPTCHRKNTVQSHTTCSKQQWNVILRHISYTVLRSNPVEATKRIPRARGQCQTPHNSPPSGFSLQSQATRQRNGYVMNFMKDCVNPIFTVMLQLPPVQGRERV